MAPSNKNNTYIVLTHLRALKKHVAGIRKTKALQACTDLQHKLDVCKGVVSKRILDRVSNMIQSFQKGFVERAWASRGRILETLKQTIERFKGRAQGGGAPTNTNTKNYEDVDDSEAIMF